jgi:hypothetical protein
LQALAEQHGGNLATARQTATSLQQQLAGANSRAQELQQQLGSLQEEGRAALAAAKVGSQNAG